MDNVIIRRTCNALALCFSCWAAYGTLLTIIPSETVNGIALQRKGAVFHICFWTITFIVWRIGGLYKNALQYKLESNLSLEILTDAWLVRLIGHRGAIIIESILILIASWAGALLLLRIGLSRVEHPEQFIGPFGI